MARRATRTVPQDLDAEAGLLGAALIDTAAADIAAGLAVGDWYKPGHAHIAAAIAALRDRGEPTDPVTVAHHLDRTGLLDTVGGHQALIELMSACPATSSAPSWARIIADSAHKRRIITLATELTDAAYNGHDAAAIASTAAEALDQLAAQAQPDATTGLRLTPAATVRVDRPAWAWDQRIPLAGVTLIPGREGEGKTALVGHLCARLTRGQLPGDRWGRPGDVIYIGHEDDRATVLVPRLIAAGADLERFWFVDLPTGVPFTIAVDIAALARQVTNRDIAAIVLDPLDAHLGVADTHKKAEVQAAITRLAALTQQARCAGIGIAHLNKGDARDVLLKVVGSVGLTTSVRSVVAVGPNPQAPDTEKVAVLRKANMTNAREVPAVRFRVEAATIPHPHDEGGITTAKVAVLGEIAGIDADAILDVASPEQRSDLEHAADWLDSVLSGGPLPKAEILKLARAEGITDRTLARARERLSVVIERDDTARGRPSRWGHPDPGDYVPTITCQEGLA